VAAEAASCDGAVKNTGLEDGGCETAADQRFLATVAHLAAVGNCRILYLVSHPNSYLFLTHPLTSTVDNLTDIERIRRAASEDDKNSSGDEIANVNFFYDDIVHVVASAYAH